MYEYVYIEFISYFLFVCFVVFFFNDTATTEIYTLSLHDALPIYSFDSVPYPNVPDTDFSQEESRDAALGAIPNVLAQLGQTYLPLINGNRVDTSASIPSENPSNSKEIIGSIGLASQEQAEEAIAAAKAAFSGWKNTPVAERAGVLRRAAKLMEERREELNAWICLEVGKVLRQGDPEISEAIDFCNYYADEMERLSAGEAYDYPGETNRYFYQPRGITLVVSPWNFPFAIPVGMVTASLVAGNCTILKPAGTAAVIASKITEILVDAGVPKGVFQYLPSRGSTVGQFMVEHPDIHTIVFTGSQDVGCQIFESAAKLRPGQRHLK